jgi:hypothetical protein
MLILQRFIQAIHAKEALKITHYKVGLFVVACD